MINQQEYQFWCVRPYCLWMISIQLIKLNKTDGDLKDHHLEYEQNVDNIIIYKVCDQEF